MSTYVVLNLLFLIYGFKSIKDECNLLHRTENWIFNCSIIIRIQFFEDNTGAEYNEDIISYLFFPEIIPSWSVKHESSW